MSEGKSTSPRSGKTRGFLIAGAIVVASILALLIYRGYSRTHITTDDAFVEGAIHMVASRVSGTVIEVPVSDNETVQKGSSLVKLDPEPFQQALAEAEASLRTEQSRSVEFEAHIVSQGRRVAAARASLLLTRDMKAQLAAGVEAHRAETRAKTASLTQARLDLSRAETLHDQEVVPRSRLDRARTAVEMETAVLEAAREFEHQAEAALNSHKRSIAQARAHLNAEEAALQQARASLQTQAEQIARRQAQVEMARLKLGYTQVAAPADGSVTRLAAEVGNTVQAGQPLMSLVSLQSAFVVANYKETRVGRILPGQKVTMKMDALPGRKFSGRVDSIMAGTGAAFTLFPPENASGNYVKVVQRIPVKIVFDDIEEIRPYLKIGISVVPTVLTEE